ncbi:MAG: hypothetical protein Ta2A_14910 [Treponemataceae bacterium]|nr:MAG: hypothetical protein Ta2A_14910 [Treponemataceae bacterium]
MLKRIPKLTVYILFFAAFVLFSPILQGCSALFEAKIPPTPTLDEDRVYETGSVNEIEITISWMYDGQNGAGYANNVTIGLEPAHSYPLDLHPTTTNVLLTVVPPTVGDVLTYTLTDITTDVRMTSQPIVSTDYRIILTEQIENHHGVIVSITLAGKNYFVRLEKAPTQANIIYVSSAGNGLHNDDEYAGNELRGRSPGTAYYSLTTAIRKAVRIGAAAVVILSDLDSDQVNYAENKPFTPGRNALAGESIFFARNARAPLGYPLRIIGRNGNVEGAQVELRTGGGAGTAAAPNYTNRRVFTILGSGSNIQFEHVTITDGGKNAVSPSAISVRDGGGIYIADGATVILGTSAEICDNEVAARGGGVFLTGVYSRFISSGKIHNNKAGNASENFGEGGGIWVDRLLNDAGAAITDPPPTLVLRGEVYENYAFRDGGGVYIGSVNGGSIASFESGAAVYNNQSDYAQITMPLTDLGSIQSGRSSGVYYAGKTFTISGDAFVSNDDNNFLLEQDGSTACRITVSGELDTGPADWYRGETVGYHAPPSGPNRQEYFGIVIGLVRSNGSGTGSVKVLDGDFATNHEKIRYNSPTSICINSAGYTEAIP